MGNVDTTKEKIVTRMQMLRLDKNMIKEERRKAMMEFQKVTGVPYIHKDAEDELKKDENKDDIQTEDDTKDGKNNKLKKKGKRGKKGRISNNNNKGKGMNKGMKNKRGRGIDPSYNNMINNSFSSCKFKPGNQCQHHLCHDEIIEYCDCGMPLTFKTDKFFRKNPYLYKLNNDDLDDSQEQQEQEEEQEEEEEEDEEEDVEYYNAEDLKLLRYMRSHYFR